MSAAAAFRVDESSDSGAFERQQSRFRGQPQGGPERHHLYVALACPWSHRVVIARKVKGLEETLSMSLAAPFRDERGWAFPGGRYVDDLHGWSYLREGYPEDFEGRVTVPVLWDKEEGTLVSNESADIVRILDRWGTGPVLVPPELRDEIEQVNEHIYEGFQNAVYRAGFAKSQRAYDEAYESVFSTLPWMEDRLADRRFLMGDEMTEADWRLLPTLVRFDPVYHTHFRCNGARLTQFPNLIRYTRELVAHPGIRETIALDEIREHYYTTHDELNPKRLIPRGPLDLGWD